jgi:hypothetical protein
VLQSAPGFAATVDGARQYLNLLCRLLRHLSPHPAVWNAAGPPFTAQPMAPDDPTQLELPLVTCLFGMVTSLDAFPPVLRDALHSALGQLMLGFPSESNAHTAQVCFPALPASQPASTAPSSGVLDLAEAVTCHC